MSSETWSLPSDRQFGRVTYHAPLEVFTDLAGQRHERAVAVHDEAPSAEATDWAQILALYTVLERTAPNPMVALNRAVALAMVRGPAAGLAVLDSLSTDERIARFHRVVSVRAHLVEVAGDRHAARSGYREAARRTTSEPERRHLLTRAARVG